MAGNELSLAGHLRRFPQALGALLAAPGRALGEIEAAERGGFSLLLSWCLAAAVALRFVNLADAVAGWDAGGGVRVVSVLVGELTQAVPVALGAALAIVILAGAKREPSVDLELGCAVAIPFEVARAAFRAGAIVAQREPPVSWVWASYGVAATWGLACLVIAIRIARGRPAGRPPEPPPAARLRARWAGVAALGVLGVGLGGGVRWTAAHAGGLGPVAKGVLAPDFTLPRIDGKPGSVTLSSLRGRVVLLDFWATWCPPCLAMLPMMHELNDEFAPEGVAFVGVDSDGPQSTPEEVTEFLASHGAPYPVVIDDGHANEAFRVKVLPTLVLVGKDGAVDRVFIGMTSKGTLAKAMEAALAR